MALRDVTDRDFDRIVEAAATPVLVEFWQPGCGHCLALMTVLETLQEDLGNSVLILKMNVEENFQIPAELEISSLPALALYNTWKLSAVYRRDRKERCHPATACSVPIGCATNGRLLGSDDPLPWGPMCLLDTQAAEGVVAPPIPSECRWSMPMMLRRRHAA